MAAGSTSPRLDHESFAVLRPLALLGAASYPVSVRRLAVSLPASFTPASRHDALRFASVAAVSFREDFHLRVDVHAGRTEREDKGGALSSPDQYCLNIEGIARELPLFEPPIDPALLIKAKALGVKLDEVLNSLAAPQPMYRFLRLHAKAQELAGAVLDLGRSLLGTFEKRDGEALSLLRQGHEQHLLEAEREVRTQAIDEAKSTLEGLRAARRTIERRFTYYDTIQKVIPEEAAALFLSNESGHIRTLSQLSMSLAAALRLIPETTVGLAPGVTFGGSNAGESTKIGAAVADLLSGVMATEAQSLATTGGWRRRSEEWKLQRDLAERELAQNDRQLVAQEIRVAITEQELRNLDLRRSQSAEVERFLRERFTSAELYDWMTGQLAGEHYKAYQLAFDMAKRAERSYQLERGDTSTFVRFGAWDSLKKGLLAGERLLQDLRAMDVAYLTKAEREKELVKHVSLGELADASSATLNALTNLRETGSTEVVLPEALFDADYPGQYFRRLKTVAISVETVKPTRDGVQSSVTLVSSKARTTSASTSYAESPAGGDARFRYDTTQKTQLVTSSGEQDTGLFELNLRDDMLLPFEGAGAVSRWRVAMDNQTNRFPRHRVRDVVLHLRYTAKDAGSVLAASALSAAAAGLTSRMRMFAAKHDFEDAWSVFLKGNGGSPVAHELDLRIHEGQLLSFFGDPKVKLTGVELSAVYERSFTSGTLSFTLKTPHDAGSGDALSLPVGAGLRKVSATLASSFNVLREQDSGFKVCRLSVAQTSFPSGAIVSGAIRPDFFDELWLSFTYAKQ